MKICTMLLLCASLLWACNNREAKPKEAQPQETAHQHNEAAPAALSLNNGAKWNSDESTNKNVAAVQEIVSSFETKSGKDLAAYKAVGTDLQAALNTLVSECRMKGKDHEALHHWLEPVLEKVKALQNATTEQEASALFDAVHEQVNLYHQYFE